MRKVLAFCFIFLSLAAGTALAASRFTVDPEGNLYRFWLESPPTGNKSVLKYSKSIDQGITFNSTQELYSFTGEAQSCDLKIGNNLNFFIAYEASKEAFYFSSTDGGKTLTVPAKITSEAASSPAIAVDAAGKTHLLFITENKYLNLKRLLYTAASSFEPGVIFESFDEIIEPGIIYSDGKIILTWQNRYLDRSKTYLAVSLDGGRRFGSIRTLPNRKTPYSTHDIRRLILEADLIPLPAPETLLPKDKTVTNYSTIEVAYRSKSPELSISKIEVSLQKEFPAEKTWVFDTLNFFGSSEARFRLPVELPEGEYFLRVSSFDGLISSPLSTITSFTIDRTSPVITLIYPSKEASEQRSIQLEGKLSEPALLTINGKPATLEADNSFKAGYSLSPGENLIKIVAADSAGNSTSISKTIQYSAACPEITLRKPGEADWLKSDSAIFIDAGVLDPQDDIEDETEGEIVFSGITLEAGPVYDKQENRLSGFVSLPKGFASGKYPVIIRLRDQEGNTGKAEFNINIDRLPPVVTIGAGEAAYSNSKNLLPMPIVDAGTGIDPSGTLVQISGVSFESAVSEGGQLFLKTQLSLSDGTYEVKVAPRDMIGNTGEAVTFNLIIDTVAPQLTILSSGESSARNKTFFVSGEAQDCFLSAVNIYNNKILLATLTSGAKEFSGEVPLFNGLNEIVIEASDRAGNKTSHTFSFSANVRSLAGLVNKFGNGPNPFSPAKDRQMYFTYDLLPSTSNLKIYIFDLCGTLIWQEEAINVAFGKGNIPWDGLNHFKARVANGVYPYLAQVSSGGSIEIRRGKIIVLQ